MPANTPNQDPSAKTAAGIPFLPDVTEYDRLLDQYSVTCFAVLDPRIDGKTQHHIPISPWFATRAQVEQCKAQKQADFPACYIATVESYFTSEYEEGRLELLTRVIGVDQGDLPRLGEFWVRSFIVVLGGEDDPDGNTPISPYFPSQEQAKAFQALSRVNYPHCRILTQDHAANDELGRQRLIALLFPEQAPGVPRQIAQYILFRTITCFAVVHGDGAGRQHLPIGPYFRTEAEAERFQAEIRAHYPHCRIAQQSFVPEDEEDREELMKQLFGEDKEPELKVENLFMVEVTTDQFFPRAKRGERLILERGLKAEKSGIDIVAVGTEDDQPVQLAFYQEGMAYFAVMTAIQYKRGQTGPTQSNGDESIPEEEAGT